MPVDVPSGVDAAGLEAPRVEVHDDPLGPRQRAPGAVAFADGRDPGARAVAVDGEADGVEGEPGGVRARENGDADDAPVAAPAIVRQRVVARWRREQDAAARRRVDDEDAGQERLGAREREEEDEAEVDVLDGEAAGSARGEVEGERRGEEASSGRKTAG